jgi:predicted dehydrogenase
MNRRTFMTRASAVTLAAGARRVLGANERVGIGLIGYGLRGRRLGQDFRKAADATIVAVSDAHAERMREAVKTLGGGARAHGDFRKVLEARDVDAVIIATPDHWHALQTMMACAAGKDVYVEKPLTRFVREGRWMVEVARRYKRVVQVGTQQRSGLHYQRAGRFIREGRLGTIITSHVDFHRNISPGFGAPPDRTPPRELDWEMFTGPAPLRPYNINRGIYHFRWFWDYAGGQMTNWGPHSLDIVYWYLDTLGPTAVYSTGGRHFLDDNCETPDAQETIFEFGNWTATISIRECSRGRGSDELGFFGTHGSLHINRSVLTVTPDPKVPAVNIMPGVTAGLHPVGGPEPILGAGRRRKPRTERVVDTSGSPAEQVWLHVRNFLDCVKSREEPIADLETGHRVTAGCHLANISLRVGRRIRWDAGREEIAGDEEASALLAGPYRKPWDAELESLGVGS